MTMFKFIMGIELLGSISWYDVKFYFLE